jgi:hypothetical protein
MRRQNRVAGSGTSQGENAMWSLRRPSDEYDFAAAESESPLLEWLTIALAIVAVIGVLGWCACPYLATPLTANGEMQRAGARHAYAGPYPFLAVFEPERRQDDKRDGRMLIRASGAANGALRPGYESLSDAGAKAMRIPLAVRNPGQKG